MPITGVGTLNWFSVPEVVKETNHLTVKKIDYLHLLARLRSTISRGDACGASRQAFVEVAHSGRTALKPPMIDEHLDMQNISFAEIFFAKTWR